MTKPMSHMKPPKHEQIKNEEKKKKLEQRNRLRTPGLNRKKITSAMGGANQFFTRASITLILMYITNLYNFYPLKPHFYIVKLWFAGVYIEDLTLVVISYEIYETSLRRVSYEMTSSVRFCLSYVYFK